MRPDGVAIPATRGNLPHANLHHRAHHRQMNPRPHGFARVGLADRARMDAHVSMATSTGVAYHRFRGHKSEKLRKMPPIGGEVAKKRPPDPAAAQAQHRKNAALRATQVLTDTTTYKVPEGDRVFPQCSSTELHVVGKGKESFTLDDVPGYFRRRRHLRETLACRLSLTRRPRRLPSL